MTQTTAFTQLPDEVLRDIDLEIQLELERMYLEACTDPVGELKFIYWVDACTVDEDNEIVSMEKRILSCEEMNLESLQNFLNTFYPGYVIMDWGVVDYSVEDEI
ncbi:hypothetical protein [Limnoraphis robusta]|uniref:Uncharacterized protein n=1 Tax=Limnoraphis robusta CCNP1315 TaxID=3110306 RepID=A0ABU5U2Z7_9CYAN|nr:hypothetical protein [Limnoraphis robusta]MEA5521385.1 hypothetical protein [Limnoraphis robusta CCNP1315]MEA5547938.1 hypothetical protein [Limnoraphis robusta CCNP1324]